MNYRNTIILSRKTLGTAGTEIIPLNIKDVISRITLSYVFTMVGHGMESYRHKNITKIEIVDGSDVLFSVDGGQCQALCIYDRKCATMNHYWAMATLPCYSTYGIDFGRYLYDPELALDPTKFRNLQLKITYDVDVCDEGASANSLEVEADVFDEKVVSPVGFLMSKEHYNAVPPASGYRYIDLPTDHPYRKMLVQGYCKDQYPQYTVDEVRLDEDNEKRIPFDLEMWQYQIRRQAIDTPVSETVIGEISHLGTRYFYVTPTEDMLCPMFNPIDGEAGFVFSNGYHVGGKLKPESFATDFMTHMFVRGWLPNHCYQFPFGDQMDIADWYDVTKVGSLRVRLHVATYSGDARQAIVLQQLRRY